MIKTSAAFIFVVFANLLIGANPITPGSASIIGGSATTTVSVTASDTLFVSSFMVGTMIQPAFSSTNGTTWTEPSTISTSMGTPAWATFGGNGTPAFMTTWMDGGGLIQDVTSSSSTSGIAWTTPTIITSSPGLGFLVISAENATGFVATWRDTNDNNPHGAFSTNAGSTWILSTINLAGTLNSEVMVGANGNGFMATWQDTMQNGLASFSLNGTAWGTAHLITGAGNLASDVCVSGTDAGFMATWGDNSGFAFSSFSSDNGISWSTPVQIASNVIGNSDVTVSGSDVGFVAAWIDSSNVGFASFSGDHGAHWSEPVQVTTTISADLVNFIGVTVIGESCMFTWHEAGTNNAMSSFSTVVPVTAPSNIAGSQHKNDFGTQYELFNEIKWGASSFAGVVGYNIYRDGTKIASVNASTLKYKDHNRKKGVATSYAITSFDASGNESIPETITIN